MDLAARERLAALAKEEGEAAEAEGRATSLDEVVAFAAAID